VSVAGSSSTRVSARAKAGSESAASSTTAVTPYRHMRRI
jgi:hypothetical protein